MQHAETGCLLLLCGQAITLSKKQEGHCVHLDLEEFLPLFYIGKCLQLSPFDFLSG